MPNQDLTPPAPDPTRLTFYAFTVPKPFGSPEDTFAHYVRAFTSMARRAGVYAPLFGHEIDTMDFQPLPGRTDVVVVYHHVEFGVPKPNVPSTDWLVEVELNTQPLHVAAMQNKLRWLQREENLPPYQQPLMFIFLHWAKNDRHFWFMNLDYDYRWRLGQRLDVRAPTTAVLNAVTFAPQDPRHFDLEDPVFWRRGMDCSSLVFWVLIWGLYRSGTVDYRSWFRRDWGAVNAGDCVSPGVLLWLLDRYGLVHAKEVRRYGG